jgi:hypothetical protein
MRVNPLSGNILPPFLLDLTVLVALFVAVVKFEFCPGGVVVASALFSDPSDLLDFFFLWI